LRPITGGLFLGGTFLNCRPTGEEKKDTRTGIMGKTWKTHHFVLLGNAIAHPERHVKGNESGLPFLDAEESM